eukprot:3880099-Rhodomonas_salina.1
MEVGIPNIRLRTRNLQSCLGTKVYRNCFRTRLGGVAEGKTIVRILGYPSTAYAPKPMGIRGGYRGTWSTRYPGDTEGV